MGQLTIKNLAVQRGQRILFRDLSMRLGAGEGCVLHGPNGAGKTSLLRTLAGFIAPADGRIIWQTGHERETEHDITEACHYIGHLNAIKSGFTVRENLLFWSGYLAATHAPAQLEARVNEALEAFGIRALAEFPAGLMSAGQKRRLCLARLLAAPRPLWLLDEPSVSLDTKSRQQLADIVDTHIRTGGSVIAATHVPLGMGLGHRLIIEKGTARLATAKTEKDT